MRLEDVFDIDDAEDAPDEGIAFVNCRRCLRELAGDELLASTFSPKTYSRQQVSIAPDGLQVWCVRHGVNIARLRLRGAAKE